MLDVLQALPIAPRSLVPDGWSLLLSLLVAASALAAYLWWHFSRRFQRLGVPYLPPLPLVGNMLDMALNRKSIFDAVDDLYGRLSPHPYGGVFSFMRPFVMIRDPEIIRAVTVKDFDHFTDHVNVFGGEKSNPMFSRMLVSLKGKEWHNMRSTLSPAFTSMKMKNMFILMRETAQQMVDYLNNETEKYEGSSTKEDILTLEVKDFFTRLANDIIATTAFGVKVDSLSDPNNTFYTMGRNLLNIKPLVGFGYLMSSKLMEMLDIPFLDQKMTDYFRSMVLETVRTRQREGIVRPDMIHLLMQARRGEVESHEGGKSGSVDEKGSGLSDDDIAAQAMLFFFGGFDTVSTAMMFCSYLLATHPDVQRRLQQEVDQLMQQSGGQPSYEQVMGAQYLDMVLSETLRMYTPGAVLDRKCVRPYKLPATSSGPGLELKPGDALWVPVQGIHHDPKYFTDPEKFDPERFSPENKHLIQPFTYNPFGSGPRICIAQRFAQMETKVLVAYLLSRFTLEVVPKTPIPLVQQPNKIPITVKGGAWLGIRRRS